MMFARATQCLFATLDYARAIETLEPLVGDDSRYTAKAMALMHKAACLAATSRCSEAREAMESVGSVAKRSGGRLDAQLWQRAQAWLQRSDADLGLCALEMHYCLHYYHGQCVDAAVARDYARHAQPILRASSASSQLEPRLVALLLEGVVLSQSHIPYSSDTPSKRNDYALAKLRAASEGAADSGSSRGAGHGESYSTCPDKWVHPFALLELGKLLLRMGEPAMAGEALDDAKKLPTRYSFHSWHQSSVREAARHVHAALESGGSRASGTHGADREDEDEDESEQMREIREQLEKEPCVTLRQAAISQARPARASAPAPSVEGWVVGS